jgi:hypothetical protein
MMTDSIHNAAPNGHKALVRLTANRNAALWRTLTSLACRQFMHGSGVAPDDVETDKRSQARVMRDLVEGGWLVEEKGRHWLTGNAVDALADKATTTICTHDNEPYRALSSWSSDATAGGLYALLHPEEYRWAIVWTCKGSRGQEWAPLLIDGSVRSVRMAYSDAWLVIHAADPSARDVGLCVSDEGGVRQYQTAKAAKLWADFRGRFDLAVEDAVGAPPAHRMSRGIPSSNGYTRLADWQRFARESIERAKNDLLEAQAALAALQAQHATLAAAMGSDEPYAAIQARWEAQIAEEILTDTGVDPREITVPRKAAP